MNAKELTNSVPEEQFGDNEKYSENTNTVDEMLDSGINSPDESEEATSETEVGEVEDEDKVEDEEEDKVEEEKGTIEEKSSSSSEDGLDDDAGTEDVVITSNDSDETLKSEENSERQGSDGGINENTVLGEESADEDEKKAEAEVEVEVEAEAKAEAADEAEKKAEVEVTIDGSSSSSSEDGIDKDNNEITESGAESTDEEILEHTDEDEKSLGEDDAETPSDSEKKSRESMNFSLLSKTDLVDLLEEYLSNRPVSEIRFDVELIKTHFYKKLKAEFEQKRRDFIADGGSAEDFKATDDPDELRIRELLKKFRELRLQSNRNVDDEKQENLRRKYEIIEEIKELVNSQESINKTFQDFRELQDRWRNIGAVPQAGLNDLWDTYHHHVEKFYDYIKINNELRDLDLKKNLEEKVILTEKTEALLLESNIINAFKILQKYHEQWREIGPAPIDKRSEIWERFKEATAKINRKHQQYYQDLKDQQKRNFEQKLLMCEKAEEIAGFELSSHPEWIRKTDEILKLQEVWKTIGFAPRKDNNEVYARFRAACDSFFERKRNFYAQNMEEHNANYEKKMELCMEAESLQNSTDWKKSTDDMIRLQKKWKQIGPVPRKHSEQIWKRFRAACDKFFNRKSEHFRNIDSVYETNLALKEALIEEVSKFKSSGDMQKDLETLQELQRKWAEIGFVPRNKKEEVQQKFRDVINLHLDKLDVDDVQKNVIKYESRLENLVHRPGSGQKLKFEREKLMNKLIQLKNDISIYENNIGFFANTSSADEMKRDFEIKIENTKKKIQLLEEKINLIDELDLDN